MRTRSVSTRRLLAMLGLGLGLVLGPTARAGEPPSAVAADVVVTVLHDRALSPAQHRLRLDRQHLQDRPDDLTLALQVAHQALALARQGGDSRYLAQVIAALTPWWSRADAPEPVRLVRATVRQTQHDFDAALDELKDLTQVAPTNAQAWWTLATLYQLQGQYGPAAQACAGLRASGATWQADVCRYELLSFQGQAPEARAGLARLMWRAPSALRAHLVLLRAELAQRLGEHEEATQLFDTLAEIAQDPYSESALADWWLDQGRADQVWQRLQGRTRHDGLLLRLTEAAVALRRPEAPGLVALLTQRLLTARHRGEHSIHWREEARFQLHVLKQPRRALPLALKNWSIQKEPIDARLLLEAARAAGRPQDAQPMLDFVRAAGWTDVRLGVGS